MKNTFEPCGHEPAQSAAQLHGVCVFCYRDRLGKAEAERVENNALKQRVAASTLDNQELQRQLAETTHLLNYHRSTRTGEAAETNFALEEKLAAKEKDRQYHMDAIIRLANFLGLAGTSHEIVQAAMDNMTRFAKGLPELRIRLEAATTTRSYEERTGRVKP